MLKRMISLLLAFALVFGLCADVLASSAGVQVRAAPLSNDAKTMDGMVRVWLSSLGSPTSLNLTINGNYSIRSSGEFLSHGTRMAVSFNSSSGAITISYNGQQKSVGRSFSLRRHSTTGSNGILISESRENQNPYPGDLSFEAVPNGSGYRLYVIAHIYIETYLYGVLPYEMGNSTNIEALKAQAVAARTYTVRMMQSRSSGRYDVQDTTSDQVYRGTPSGNANCVSAIDQTKGIVLMYGSSYITTYYSASNGGQTETSRSGTSYAYMTVKDDPFDYANTSSTVKKKTIYTNLESASNPSQLISLLKSKAISKLNSLGYAANTGNTTLKTLQSITPHTPKYASPSRLYTKMDFTFAVSTRNASGQTVTVTQTVTCDIFNELESMLSLGIQSSANELWTVEKVSGGLQIQARRYGHGMGMSQRGAMQMAKVGYSYDEILGFYYENCSRVRHSFTNSILSSSSDDEEITVEDAADLETGDSSICKGRVSLAGVGATLAIRSDRSENAQILHKAANGALVEVLSNDGSWCLVRYGDICGYVPTGSLVITGEPTGEMRMVTSIAGFVTVTANDYVNLRADGSMSAKVLGTAPAGAVLTVLSTGSGWMKVQYNALVAYVNSNFISALQTGYPGYEQPEDDETTQPPEDDSDTGDTAKLSATVATEYGSLNMRAEGYAGSRILTTIPRGEVIEVEERGSVWSRVYYQGQSGYVMSCYLAFENTEEEPSEQVSSTATVTTPGGTLNLRSEPRTGSQILWQIPQYALVQVHEKGAEWCRVTYQGITGYVMTVFLTFQAVQPEEDEEEQEDVQLPDNEQQTILKAVVTTASGSLNMRAEPSLYARVIGSVPRQATVEVSSYGAEWCEIVYQNLSGYAMTRFLSILDEPDEEPESEEPQPEETPEVDAQTMTAYVQTVLGGLNLRAQPGSSYRIVTTIPRYAQVMVTGYGADWCAVQYGGYEGYVMTSFLRFEKEEPSEGDNVDSGWEELPDESNAVMAWVSTQSGSLNLRSSPDANALVLIEIPQFAQVKLLEEGNTWSAVKYQDQYGYVMTKYLTAGIREETREEEEEPEVPEESTQGPETDPTLRAPDSTLYALNDTQEELSLWAMCWKSGAPLGKVPAGELVEVLLLGEKWCCVSYENVQGYCLREELSVLFP